MYKKYAISESLIVLKRMHLLVSMMLF